MDTVILGTGSYLPSSILTSAELGDRLGVGEQWILDRTGIRERRVAAPEEATSDLASVAARRALDAAKIDPLEVDLIIVATSTPDRLMPATACLVQANIGAHHAFAFDIDAVCSGFVYALVAARGLVMTNPTCRTALVIGADTYSRVLNYDDRRTAVLFGDGAGAVVLRRESRQRGVLASTLVSDGRMADLVQIPAGGSRKPPSPRTISSGEHYFTMQSGNVRRLANRVLPELVHELVKLARLELSDVGVVVPHQANGVMLSDWARELGLAPGTMHLTVDRYGNTGAASVPITLDDAFRAGRILADTVVLLVAFGGGMTWGGVVLRWPSGTRD
jgi:3-oxoacyl-(acyl-carrier-protein) synthase III